MTKILYIGFGISPFSKGGAIIYQDSLAKEISTSGWQVSYFFSVPRYSYTISNRPYLKKWQQGAIKFIELCNSPNYPGCFSAPGQQCRNPDLEKLTKELLEEEKPDIIHFHELQMHTASVIGLVAAMGLPAVKTIHNYYDVCPQRDLMYKGKEVCTDFEEGARCVECMKAFPVRNLSLTKRFASVFLPPFLYEHLSKLYKKTRGRKNIQFAPGGNYCDYPDQYDQRRKYFVEMLNKLNVIHCSSFRSAEILTKYGVLKEKIQVLPLSVKNIERIFPKPFRGTSYPVVFGYVGGKYYHKGYDVLIDAFSKLDQIKAKLVIYSTLRPDISDCRLNVEWRKYYDPAEINQSFSDIDVGVIPSRWEEVFGIIGIEWLAARIPVIGCAIGGIPEWLKDAENGFLVAPNDAEQLKQKMEAFVKNPGMIAQLQKKIKPQQDFSKHVEEMLDLYKSIMGKKR